MTGLGRDEYTMNLKIQPIRSLYDLKKTHDIQRNTWGYRDEMIFPYTIMTSTRHSGGVLLGAYIDDSLVGFLYGYLGMGGGSLYLFSQRMGILPEYQGLGIGTALKLAQREQMLRQGIDLVVWTYEPLAGISARLNVEKLGGIVRTYVRDIYGTVENPLQAGLAMDRLLVEWHLMSDRVRTRVGGHVKQPSLREWLEEKKYPIVNFANWNDKLPRPIAADLELDDKVLLVQVPPDLQAIKKRDLSIARGWRITTRRIFEAYFRRGYVITGFAGEKSASAPNTYKLEHKPFPATVDFSSWATGLEDDLEEKQEQLALCQKS